MKAALLCSLFLQISHLVDCTCSQDQLSRFRRGWPEVLDVGIYWYDQDDHSERASGQQSQFYDPAKPTLIFVHGWTGYGKELGVQSCRRWTSACAICKDQRPLARPWVQRGWNYGIFYWDQFADEPCTRDTELKVWLNPSKPEGLTWKSYNIATDTVTVRHYDRSMPSLGHLCANVIRQALGSFSGSVFRLVGHSFGAQLATYCAQLLHEETPHHPAVPGRLVLLDPWFTGNLQHVGQVLRKAAGPLQRYFFHCDPLTNTTSFGAIATTSALHAIQFLWKRRVPTELYKGSLLSMTKVVGNPFKELETLATYVVQNVDGGYCHHNSLDCGHSSLVPLYMERIADTQPSVENGEPVGNCSMPGPACSDEQIRVFIHRNNELIEKTGKRVVWHQNKGIYTIRSSDDTYRSAVEPVPTTARLPHMLRPLRRFEDTDDFPDASSPRTFLKRVIAAPISTASSNVIFLSVAAIGIAGSICGLRAVFISVSRRERLATRDASCCERGYSRSAWALLTEAVDNEE